VSKKRCGVRRVFVVGLVALLASCLDGRPSFLGPRDPAVTTTAPAAIVSNPEPEAAAVRGGVSLRASSTTDAVYVSLQPGTIPSGGLATIRNTRTGTKLPVAMDAGGFDPVPVQAAAGDTLALEIDLVGGGTQSLRLTVPAARPPIVVRTDPAPRKRDVPLNAYLVTVFSEPISPSTAARIRLLLAGVPVSGHVTVTADGLRAQFQPDGLLAPNADYELSIPTDVTDLTGDHIPQVVSAQFTTGTGVAAASVVTEQPALFTNPFSGALRTFNMSAVRWDDGSFSGSFSIFYPQDGVRVFGRVRCFSIVGDSAWIGGVIEGANDTSGVRHESAWRVVDHGPPGGGVPDELSLMEDLAEDTIGTALDYCAKRPTDLEVIPLTSGNIVVNGSGPPPPPPPPMSEIAFAVWPNGGIQVINADGSGGRILTTASDWHPTWSPDGTRLAFSRVKDDQSTSAIYVINADGSGLRQLTSGAVFDAHPAWSPDGRRLAFYRDGGIDVMNANDGSGMTRLTESGYNPTWSPDGTRIAFASSRSGTTSAIYVMNADGSNVRQVTNDPSGDYVPSWSPDGGKIAFQRGVSGVGVICLISPDGTGLTQVTLFGHTPSWSPDGRVIVFEQYGLHLVNVDGSGMMRLGIGFDPAWSPFGTMPVMPQPYASISIAGGNGQTGTALAALPQPLTVLVSRDDGAPAAGVHVSWYLLNGGLPSGPSLSSYGSVTDASGLASVWLTLGAAAPQQLKVHAAVTDGTGRTAGVEFTANAVP